MSCKFCVKTLIQNESLLEYPFPGPSQGIEYSVFWYRSPGHVRFLGEVQVFASKDRHKQLTVTFGCAFEGSPDLQAFGIQVSKMNPGNRRQLADDLFGSAEIEARTIDQHDVVRNRGINKGAQVSTVTIADGSTPWKRPPANSER